MDDSRKKNGEMDGDLIKWLAFMNGDVVSLSGKEGEMSPRSSGRR